MFSGFSGWRRLLLLFGSMGPLGHAPASGTVTVIVVGVPLFWLSRTVAAPVYLVAIVLLTGFAIWIHSVGDRTLGEKDSRRLVWDELVGFLLAVTLVPFTWQTAVLAVVVERALDIAKVPPANWIERNVPGGWGVVGDDVVAGLYTCGALHLVIATAPPALLGISA